MIKQMIRKMVVVTVILGLAALFAGAPAIVLYTNVPPWIDTALRIYVVSFSVLVIIGLVLAIASEA